MGTRLVRLYGLISLLFALTYFLNGVIYDFNPAITAVGVVVGLLLGASSSLICFRALRKKGEIRTTPKKQILVLFIAAVAVFVITYLIVILGLTDIIISLSQPTISMLLSTYVAELVLFLRYEKKNKVLILGDMLRTYVVPKVS